MKEAKLFIFLFYLLFIFANNAKSNSFYLPKDSATNKEKWHLGYTFSSNNCYRSICNYDKANPYVKNHIDSLNAKQTPDYGYSIGLTIEKNVSKDIFIESGLLWKDHTYKTLNNYSLFHTYYQKYTYYFISMPSYINDIFFSYKKFSFFIGAGIVPEISIKAKEETITDNTSDEGDYNIKQKILFDGSGKIGITVSDKQIKFTVYTNINYSFIGIKHLTHLGDNMYDEHLYYYGFGANLTF
jgi:hypothetical protein